LHSVSCADNFSGKSLNSSHWVYIDFRDFSKTENPRKYILDSALEFINNSEILSDYAKCISRAYGAEFDRRAKGPLSLLRDDEPSLRKAMYDHIDADLKAVEPYVFKILGFAARASSVYLVIDNVDQIDEPEVQENVFLEALSVSRKMGANLVLAMRDYTYVKNKNAPLFDAFDFDSVYIDPPPVAAVLAARFRLAEQLCKGKHIEETSRYGARVELEDASEVVSLLRTSVLGSSVGHIIDVAATGDIRLALRMTRQFLQYGYASSLETYLRFRTGNSVKLAEHEAIRALMFGNQPIYRDEYSTFLNPLTRKPPVQRLSF
jgi:hypothetical protein